MDLRTCTRGITRVELDYVKYCLGGIHHARVNGVCLLMYEILWDYGWRKRCSAHVSRASLA